MIQLDLTDHDFVPDSFYENILKSRYFRAPTSKLVIKTKEFDDQPPLSRKKTCSLLLFGGSYLGGESM